MFNNNPYNGIDNDAEYLIKLDTDPDDPTWKCPYCGLIYHPSNLFYRGKKPHTFKCDKCNKLVKCGV